MPAPTSSLLSVARAARDQATGDLLALNLDPEVEAYAVAYLDYLGGRRSMRPTSLPIQPDVAADARQRVLDVLLAIQRASRPGMFTFDLRRQGGTGVSLVIGWPTGSETIVGMLPADLRELRDQLSIFLANHRDG